MILTLIALHFVLGIAIVAAGDRVGRRGFAIAALAPIVTLAWLMARAPAVVDGTPVDESVAWVPTLGLELAMRLDAFGVVMVGLISGIGLLVCVYALGYFAASKRDLGRLAGLLTMFAGAMLGIVLSDHLLALFVFWELTSVTSYLLIGNDDREPAARDAALTAILITGTGGLVLLAGFVMIGQSAGTYLLSELIADPPTGGVVTAGVICALIGAFTKSAQVPFAGWLPGAMVAPTPISAYLHAATMVKAGVYLVARLSPLFAVLDAWRPIVLAVAGTTMIVGGWRALRQHDLKLLLAYGTVSQLGFLMLLLGAGPYDLAQAGVVLLVAHGAFKAALFMVVGIIDHETGTRDVRRLHGFGPGWWPITVIAVVGAASMAGFPPLVGFIAKEKALDAAEHATFGGATWLLVTIVVGSVLTVAYSGRFVLGVLGRLGEPEHAQVSRSAHTPATGFIAPAALLTVITVATGLAPVLLDDTVRAATLALHPESSPKPVVLWAGFNVALLLSTAIIAVGLTVVMLHRRVASAQHAVWRAVKWFPSADRVFWGAVNRTLRLARGVTAIVQNGSLPVYLMVILAVSAIAPLIPAVTALDRWPAWNDTPMHLPIAALIAVAAVGSTVVRRRIAAALMLGAVGFGMAGFYVVQGAPDLALTQFSIEILATVLFVLVLRFLPRRFTDPRDAVVAPLRIAVAVTVAASVFVLAIVATGARADVDAASGPRSVPVSQQMLDRSVPEAKGSNVVNVILVDFRGFDTLGEVTVLVVAALGAVTLARTGRRSGARAGDRNIREVPLVRLPVVDAASRLLFPSIMVLSLYFLFAGHNQPGGGFVGGLTAGAAISLRYVAGGVDSVRRSFRLAPWTVLGGGLLLAGVTAVVPLLLGDDLLQHRSFERDLPLLGVVKTTTALPFDIGVYLVVVGLVLMAYEAFGDEVAPDDDLADDAPDDQFDDQFDDQPEPAGTDADADAEATAIGSDTAGGAS